MMVYTWVKFEVKVVTIKHPGVMERDGSKNPQPGKGLGRGKVCRHLEHIRSSSVFIFVLSKGVCCG